MIKHNPLQQALTEFVAATDYPAPIPKIGKLDAVQLAAFNKFFTNVSDELGSEIYYVGCGEGYWDNDHTFTNRSGWLQYHQFIKRK